MRFSETSHSLTVPFTDVPEFPAVGANTFTITLLHRSLLDGSSRLTRCTAAGSRLDYGALSATDGLAGYSCGGKMTSGFELETDLSGLRCRRSIGHGGRRSSRSSRGPATTISTTDASSSTARAVP